MITEYKYFIKYSKPPYSKKTFQKNSIINLDFKKILSESINNNILRNDLSTSKILNKLSFNETENSIFRSKLNLKKSFKISNKFKFHKKINSLLDDIHTTQDSISSQRNSLRKKIDNYNNKRSNNDISFFPNSSRENRLINKWNKIYTDLNNFSKENSENKKFKKKVKSIEIINSNFSNNIKNDYQIKEPNFIFGNNEKKEKKNEKYVSPHCNLINLTRKMLEVKISNSFRRGKNLIRNNSRNNLKDIEREFNIKYKIREINRFQFNDKKSKVSYERKKEIKDNNIKLMDIFRNNIHSKDNLIEQDIDINIDNDEKIKK